MALTVRENMVSLAESGRAARGLPTSAAGRRLGGTELVQILLDGAVSEDLGAEADWRSIEEPAEKNGTLVVWPTGWSAPESGRRGGDGSFAPGRRPAFLENPRGSATGR